MSNSKLTTFFERIIRLEEEKQVIADDIKDVYAEVKSEGFDTKALRKAISLSKRTPDEVKDEFDILQIYCAELGIQLFDDVESSI